MRENELLGPKIEALVGEWEELEREMGSGSGS
jgi:hypothetical protein